MERKALALISAERKIPSPISQSASTASCLPRSRQLSCTSPGYSQITYHQGDSIA